MDIGKQIQILRKEHKISPKKLVRGLCSERTLNYIEEGKNLPDKLLADMLIQRLGKSPDKLELIISREIYQLERMQDLFEELLERGNSKKAEYLLERYAERAPKKNAYRMFYCRSRAYLAFRLKDDLQEAKEWLRKALDITLPDWRSNALEKCLISTIEMENLLAYAKVLLREGTNEGAVEAEQLLQLCKMYIDKHILDGEEHAKIYCKCAELLAEIFLARGEDDEAGALCEKAFDELRNYGILYYMQPLLDKLVLCDESVLQLESKKAYENYRNVLGHLYKQYEEDWHFRDSVFKNCYQRAYYMDYELIRGERLAQGVTQECLIEGIYENPETLSRVESGKACPENAKLEQLLERLGIEKGRYNTFIATESFEVLERKKELDRLISRKKYEEARTKLEELKRILDLNVPENRRMVHLFELILENMLNKISPNALLKEMLCLLEETYPISQNENKRVPMDREVYLLNQIAVLLRKMGKGAETEKLYLSVMTTMKKSRISVRYRFRSYNTLAINYAKQTCSVLAARENVKYILSCGKLRGLYMNCLTETCALIDNPANLSTCRIMLEEVYYLCKLAKNATDEKVISQYYEKKYGCPIT
ncbi:MAG: hypothetical protein ACI4FZ_04250 [Lachnospiraceae bacterium]